MPILQIFYEKLLEISIFISKNLLIVQKIICVGNPLVFCKFFVVILCEKVVKSRQNRRFCLWLFPKNRAVILCPVRGKPPLAFIPII